MTEPSNIVAGDTATWTVAAGIYSATTWTMSYALTSPSNKKIEITGTDVDGGHSISVDAATTADWEPGTYKWQRYVTSGLIRYTTGKGRLVVEPNAAVGNIDLRTSAEKALEALTAVRENKATQDQLSYSVQGRSLSRMSWQEINEAWLHFKNIVESEIAAENDDLGVTDNSNTVKVSFANA